MKSMGKWGICILLGAAALLLGSCKNSRMEPMEEKESLNEVVQGEEREWVVFAESLEGENEEKACEMAVQSIVRLETEHNGNVYFGSGIIWDGDEERIVIATSGHLLEEGRLLGVIFPGGRETSGEHGTTSRRTGRHLRREGYGVRDSSGKLVGRGRPESNGGQPSSADF